MKKHAKKALGHKVSVLGKTVPTMLVIGLFLVGGTSAALLNNFATISGETTAEQSVVLQDGEGGYTTTSTFGLTNPVYGGDVEVSSETLENRGETDTDVEFGTTHTETRYVNVDGTSVEVEFTHSADEVTVEVLNGISSSNVRVKLDGNNNDQMGDNKDSQQTSNPATFDLNGVNNAYQLRIVNTDTGDQSDWIEQRKGQVYGLDTTIFDVTEPEVFSAGPVGVQRGYDTTDDEVTFTFNFPQATDEDGSVHFDTDNDGVNEFHLGLYGYDTGPYAGVETVKENSNGYVTSWVLNDDENGYESGAVDGVTATIDSNRNITVSVEADKFGSAFRYGVGINSGGDYTSGNTGGSVGPNSYDSSTWGTVGPGQEVTGPFTMEGESTRDFAFVNEFDPLLQPGDYGVTVDVLPAGN